MGGIRKPDCIGGPSVPPSPPNRVATSIHSGACPKKSTAISPIEGIIDGRAHGMGVEGGIPSGGQKRKRVAMKHRNTLCIDD